MNTRQRFVNTLTGRETDRVPFIKVFGTTNSIVPDWEKQNPGISKNIDNLLQFEGRHRGWQQTDVNMTLSQLDPPQVISENETQITKKYTDGTVKVFQKNKDFHHHIIQWPVKDRNDWDRIKEKHLNPHDPKRFPADWASKIEIFNNRDYPLQLTHSGVYGFARLMMGDENLAYAFYDDPQLVADIIDTYTDVAIAIWSKMVDKIEFDLIECWEDMAYNTGAMISPETFRQFLKPNFEKIASFANAHNIPIVLVDCDGYIEDLTELMLESGVTAIYPFEAQAKNDVDRVLNRYPSLGVIGGLDKNSMAKGKKYIDREMEKVRHLIKKGRFIPGPDHFVLSDVTFENYKYFMQQLREIVLMH